MITSNNLLRGSKAVLSLLLAPLATVLACAECSGSQKTVLWLDSYALDYGLSASVYKGIQSVMKNQNAVVLAEHMDTKRYHDRDHLEKLFSVYRHKYATKKIDVVIASDDNAFQFTLKHHKALFPNTPVVFCGVNKFDPEMLSGVEHHFTGVIEDFDILGTLKAVQRLQPGVTKVLVVSDRTVTGEKNRQRLEALLSDIKAMFEVSIIDQWTLEYLKALAAVLPSDTVILILSLFQDKYGTHIDVASALRELSEWSRVPIYSCWDSLLGHGIVGGKLVSGFNQGETAARLAVRIFNGEIVASIPVVQKSPNSYYFDYNQLKKFGLSKSSLPEGSLIINEDSSLVSIQRSFLALVWAILGLLAVGVVALVGVIVHRRRYEANLRESEERYRDLFDHSADIIYTHDLDGNYTSINQAGLRILGMTEQEFLGMNFRDLVDSEFLAATENFFQMKLRGQVDKTGPYQVAVKAKDGRQLWFEVNTRMIFRDGKPIGVHGSARDITDRKHLEEELKKAQDRYKSFVEEAQDMIVETDSSGFYTFVNPATVRMLGYQESELLGKSYLEFVDPEFRNDAEDFYKTQAQMGNKISYLETQYITKDGKKLWIAAYTRLIIEDGNVKGAQCIARDISDRKRAEQALLEEEARYRELYRMLRLMCDNSPDMIWCKDLEGKYIFANRALCEKLLGAKDTDEPVGKTDMFFAQRQRSEHPERPEWHTFGEVCMDSDAVIRENPTPRRFDEFGNVKGQFLYLDVYKAPMLDEQGRMIGIVGSAREVTEEKRREEERVRLITAINQTADTIVITDTKGVIQFVNPAFEKVTGYSKDEAIGKTPSILKSGTHDANFYKKLWKTLREKKVWAGHFVNRKKDGTLYEEDATITPVKDASGRVISYVAVKRDVTKESMLQKELLHAQKMEALGTLAGGIAHDLNNVLQIIFGYCQLLSPRLNDETSLKALTAVSTAAKRAGDLVERILTFSRKVETEARPIELNKEIKRVHELLQRTIPRMIEIKLNLAEDLYFIHGDPLQLEQVFMNLAVNAAHAMPDGGTLTISTQNVRPDDDFCMEHALFAPCDYVLITVSDTGCGIPREIINRIFEPFFTTKKLGEGTGLGLSIVYGIVSNHKGFIQCESQPGMGTTFSIYLPRLEEAAEEISAPESSLNLSGHETILLVDDEDELVSLAGEAFAGYGYTLITARTGEEALRLYQDYGDKIGLVVLDLVMPGMGGRQTLHELRKMDPNVRILVASGFATEDTVKQLLKAGASGFLKKPFEFEELLLEIRQILDAG